MRSQRILVLVAGLALVLAACGGGEAEVAPPSNGSSTAETTQSQAPTTAVQTTESDAVRTTESTDAAAPSTDERPAPDPNRELAPEFSLALGDGSTFVLSEETRPVFMVFWAEW